MSRSIKPDSSVSKNWDEFLRKTTSREKKLGLISNNRTILAEGSFFPTQFKNDDAYQQAFKKNNTIPTNNSESFSSSIFLECVNKCKSSRLKRLSWSACPRPVVQSDLKKVETSLNGAKLCPNLLQKQAKKVGKKEKKNQKKKKVLKKSETLSGSSSLNGSFQELIRVQTNRNFEVEEPTETVN